MAKPHAPAWDFGRKGVWRPWLDFGGSSTLSSPGTARAELQGGGTGPTGGKATLALKSLSAAPTPTLQADKGRVDPEGLEGDRRLGLDGACRVGRGERGFAARAACAQRAEAERSQPVDAGRRGEGARSARRRP